MIPNSKNIILIVCSLLIVLISFVLLFSDIVKAHKFNIYNYLNNKEEVTLAENNLDMLKRELKEMDFTLKDLKNEEEVVREQSLEVNEKITDLNDIYGEGIGLDIASLMMLLENSADNLNISIAFDATNFENKDMFVDGGIQTVTNTVDFSGRYLDVMKHIEYLENTDFITIENVFFVNSSFTGSEYPDDIEKRVDGQYTINVFYFGNGDNLGIPPGMGQFPGMDRPERPSRPGDDMKDPTDPVGDPSMNEEPVEGGDVNIGTEQLIKGNVNSEGEKIYHVPGGTYYDKTEAEETFNTVEEAEAAGYRASER